MLDKINERIAKFYGVEPNPEAENILWEVFYAKKEEVTEACLALVHWYETTVAPDLQLLMQKRKELSTKAVYLALMVGQAGKVFRGTHVRSKLAYFGRALALAEETTVSKAQMQAYEDNGDIRKKEAEAESAHEIGKLILNQINKVLDSMTQEIADLRVELKNQQ